MAKKKTNKSALVREYLATFPGVGPSELSAKIKTDHRVDVPPAMISNLASRMKRTTTSPNQVQLDSASMLTAILTASTLIQQCGSLAAAQEALQAAQKIKEQVT